MKIRAMTRTETVHTQMWKVGDSVVAKDTEFGLSEGKVYKILARGKFYDCLVIVDDTGKEEEYSEDYFELMIQ